MAHETNETRHPDMDYAQHETMYENFLRMTKWGVISMAVLVVFLYIVIRP